MKMKKIILSIILISNSCYASDCFEITGKAYNIDPVSYTHLTLPTTLRPCVDLGGRRIIKKKRKRYTDMGALLDKINKKKLNKINI